MENPGHEYDFLVLGGGSGGYAAARTASALGMKTAVVDGSAELGGLCILRGCMPSKTLIESAERNLTIRDASEFGLRAEPGAPDIRAIRDRKRRLIGEFADYRREQLEAGKFDLHRGRGSFVNDHTLRVQPIDGSAEFAVSAKFICIATGSVSAAPPIPGLAETGYWTSDDVLDTDSLPKIFAVLGGGAIALEMAHYLEGVGCRVTLIQRSAQFLTGLDRECSDVVKTAYERRGIICHTGTKIEEVGHHGGRKQVRFLEGEEEILVEADEVLLAMGRRPASEGLDLHAAHVGVTGHKVVVSETMQTTREHIFAAGDICSPLDVVHVAIEQGEIAARNAHRLLRGEAASEEIDYRLILFGVFSHPQVAVVGQTEVDLRKTTTPYVAASYPFDDHGKSLVMGETDGFVKMIAHKETGEILGASCVGPHATDLIHEVVIAMHYRSTVQEFQTIPHYHPTLSEIWTYPAEECADQLT